MSETLCIYEDRRGETVVAFVYGEMEPAERQVFESHLSSCLRCRTELSELGAVRDRLQHWAPPELEGPLVTKASSGTATARRGALRELPRWAQFAAAMLFAGLAAGLANLDVTVRRDGVSVRTGWSAPDRPDGDGTIAFEPVSRTELAALETALREEISARPTSPATFVAADSTGEHDVIMRRVRSIIASHEQAERRELALEIADVYRTVQSQRQGDLAKIDKVLDARESVIMREAARQQRLLNAITQQVVQRQ
jgi:putative zinc finger protein